MHKESSVKTKQKDNASFLSIKHSEPPPKRHTYIAASSGLLQQPFKAVNARSSPKACVASGGELHTQEAPELFSNSSQASLQVLYGRVASKECHS